MNEDRPAQVEPIPVRPLSVIEPTMKNAGGSTPSEHYRRLTGQLRPQRYHSSRQKRPASERPGRIRGFSTKGCRA